MKEIISKKLRRNAFASEMESRKCPSEYFLCMGECYKVGILYT